MRANSLQFNIDLIIILSEDGDAMDVDAAEVKDEKKEESAAEAPAADTAAAEADAPAEAEAEDAPAEAAADAGGDADVDVPAEEGAWFHAEHIRFSQCVRTIRSAT